MLMIHTYMWHAHDTYIHTSSLEDVGNTEMAALQSSVVVVMVQDGTLISSFKNTRFCHEVMFSMSL